jgi:hypothetical protein
MVRILFGADPLRPGGKPPMVAGCHAFVLSAYEK